MMCTARACIVDAGDGARADVPLVEIGRAEAGRSDALASDAGTSCLLPTSIRFGNDGGMVIYQDEYRLDPAGTMTITRTYYRGGDGGTNACSPTLPACGAADVVSISTIAADLTDPDVQAAFAASTPPLFGRDTRPVDGTVYSIALGSGGSMLVGWACQSTSSTPCTPIPAGVQRLVDHLRSLATAMAAQAACAAL
jgi:hypothetical protein